MQTFIRFSGLFLWLTFMGFMGGLSAEKTSITLSQTQMKDLELLMNGTYAPLNSFMDKSSYESVSENMRLPDGTLYPLSVVLVISEKISQKIAGAQQISLCDPEGAVLAILELPEVWSNKENLNTSEEYFVTGKLCPISIPKHYDFTAIRKTPAELQAFFKQNGFTTVVAYPTADLLQPTHVELTSQAANKLNAHLCIFPIDKTEQCERDYFTTVKCLQKTLPYYPVDSASISLLPVSPHTNSLRDILWLSMICKNHGCTHIIIEKQSYETEQLLTTYAKEIGIEMLFKDTLSTQNDNFPEVNVILEKAYPAKDKQGFTLFMTGFSGAGKSTIAKALTAKLMEIQDRQITILDGDLIRNHLSSELGFSKEHRSINVRRVGFVAGEISKNGGIAICALIAPYSEDRLFVRGLINRVSNYIEIFVSTPLNECELRDPKNLYARAREGKLKGFTGIDDPYEAPLYPEILIDTSKMGISESVDIVLDYLSKEGFIKQ